MVTIFFVVFLEASSPQDPGERECPEFTSVLLIPPVAPIISFHLESQARPLGNELRIRS